ncbi:hypothetical protein BD289DRAFT_61334 [Coniella lustricola]|uniref:Uncharacterized protein n=1 Tax=Coniella lustricola TaxID=2025994 RepID=A0A2T3A0L8_9PEZI|nr:hypothetical protein BD289DRAFT_61334 [Coniella lustricola]
MASRAQSRQKQYSMYSRCPLGKPYQGAPLRMRWPHLPKHQSPVTSLTKDTWPHGPSAPEKSFQVPVGREEPCGRQYRSGPMSGPQPYAVPESLLGLVGLPGSPAELWTGLLCWMGGGLVLCVLFALAFQGQDHPPNLCQVPLQPHPSQPMSLL